MYDRKIKYKQFKKEQEKMVRKYRALGMTEEAIQIMVDYDNKVFRSDDKFYRHNQSFSSNDEFDEENNPLVIKFFENFSVYQNHMNDDFNVSNIENKELSFALIKLTNDQRSILTMICNGMEEVNIAKIKGVTPNAIYDCVAKIRKKIIKYYCPQKGGV